MVVVQRHLIDMAKDAPVDKMAHKAGQSGNSVALDLFKGHVDVLRGNLLCSVVQRLLEVLWVCVGSLVRHVICVRVRKHGSQASLLRFVLGEVFIIAPLPVVLIFGIPADGSHDGSSVLSSSLAQLLIALVRNDVHREVFDKFGKVASDVRNGDVQRLLHLNKPITVRNLICWE